MQRRSWTEEEDRVLFEYVSAHGPHHWDSVAQAIGVRKSGNSCRLRWFNYLSPGIRRGYITNQEKLVIVSRRYEWGNKWSRIPKKLPGRTDNEIKNFWNTQMKKEAKEMGLQVESREFLQKMREKLKGHTMNAAAEHAFTGTLPSPAAIGGGVVAADSFPLVTESPDFAGNCWLGDQAHAFTGTLPPPAATEGGGVAAGSFPLVTESPDFAGNCWLGDQAHAFTSTLPPPAATEGGGVATPSFSSLTEISDSNFWFEDHTSGYLDSFPYLGYGHHDFAYNPDEPPQSGMSEIIHAWKVRQADNFNR